MQLSAQQFGEILEALRQPAASGKAAEFRKAARIPVQAKVVAAPLHPDGIGQPYTALSRDLSFRGIGLLQTVAMQRGDRLVVRLPRGRDGVTLIACLAVHSVILADGLYGIGAEFAQVVNNAPDLNLIDPAAHEQVGRIRESILL